ncbi:MAG: hypothetical protein IT378_05730 [Sandaracinaceae bacterium]|nr:hypothetical protein [Sandaracinaceae bacterium]
MVGLRAGALALLLFACSEGPSTQGLGAPVAPPPPRSARPAPEALYGPEGELLESDERVAGLALPRGLSLTREDGRLHVYASRAPVEKLLRYFGPRLDTLNVEQRGTIVVYHDATPRHGRGGLVRLDVTIQPSSAHAARLEIYERPPPPPPGTQISEEEIRRALERAQAENRE